MIMTKKTNQEIVDLKNKLEMQVQMTYHWRILYDALKQRKNGKELTYEQERSLRMIADINIDVLAAASAEILLENRTY